MNKVFLSYFSRGLQTELKLESSNIQVQDFIPGSVATKMSKQKESFNCISPEKAAQLSLDDLGRTDIS